MAPKVFDADARATEREAAGLKLNGKTYSRRKRANRVMREVRRLSREQTDLQEQLDRVTRARDVERLEVELENNETTAARRIAINDELREIREARDEDAIAEVEDQYELTLYRMLEALLGPNENGDEITAETLADELDFTDAVDLSKALMDVDDEKASAEPDPT